MTAAQVVTVLETLEERGVEAWVDGGWGVDALLGEQTRDHDDLDLVVARRHLPDVVDMFMSDGYAVERDLLPTAVGLRHADDRAGPDTDLRHRPDLYDDPRGNANFHVPSVVECGPLKQPRRGGQMPWTAPRRTRLGLVVAGLLLVSACGGEEPEALEPIEPAVPADLCAIIPDATRTGLVSNSTADETGNPTAACSLRSPAGSTEGVRALVTWVQVNDEDSAVGVLESQCRSIDRTEFKEQAGFQAAGADQACAASSQAGGADAATMAALAGRDVVTVRYTSSASAGGKTPSIQVAQQMLEGVLASMAG